MRPAWSAGIFSAPPTPVWWHRRQSVRPSSVCGIAGMDTVAVAVGLGDGLGDGDGEGEGDGAAVGEGCLVGVGDGDGAAPPQDTTNTTVNSIAATKKPSMSFLFILALPALNDDTNINIKSQINALCKNQAQRLFNIDN